MIYFQSNDKPSECQLDPIKKNKKIKTLVLDNIMVLRVYLFF